MGKPSLKEIRQSAIILFGNNNFDKKTRVRQIIKERQVIHYVCNKAFKHSLESVGMEFGMVNHATVIHSCKTIENEISYFSEIRENVRELINLIKTNSCDYSPESIIINILADVDIKEDVKIQLRQVLELISELR